MSSVLDALIENPPLETSGARTSNSFTYQVNWALCHLLHLHLETKDYIVVFEQHEDVLVIDGNRAHDKAHFYQIKTTRSGNWTVARLTKKKPKKKVKKGEKSADTMATSILAKLIQKKIAFDEKAESLNVVSNAPYNFDLLSEGRNSIELKEIQFGEIETSMRQDIEKRIAKEYEGASITVPDSVFSNIQECLNFVVDDLSLTDSAGHATGKLVEFLEEVKPSATDMAKTLYRTLHDDIRRKFDYEWSPTSPDELVLSKGITAAEFQSHIDDLPEKDVVRDTWDRIEQRLNMEGIALSRVANIRASYQRLVVERMNMSNDCLPLLQSGLRTYVQGLVDEGSVSGIEDLIKKARGCQHTIEEVKAVDDQLLEAMILVAYYER